MNQIKSKKYILDRINLGLLLPFDLPKKWKNDKEIALAMLRVDYRNYINMSDSLKNNIKIRKFLVKRKGNLLLYYIDDKYIKHQKILNNMIKTYGAFFGCESKDFIIQNRGCIILLYPIKPFLFRKAIR